MIALRVLTYIEVIVRSRLAEEKEELSGLYAGQPKRKTARPTAVRILRAIVRMEITAVRLESAAAATGSLTALPPLLARFVALMNLPRTL
jgi:hypothetical protein